MSKCFRPLAGLVLAFCAGLANANPVSTLVDFDGLKGGKLLPSLVGSSYSEDGYTITSVLNDDLFATARIVDADHHGETLTSSSATFRSSSGAAFDLDSLDLSNAFNTRGGSVLLTYWAANAGPAFELLSLDNKAGLQTFELNLDDLAAFNLTSLGFQVDNITVSSVPEPDSLALTLAGLGMVIILARRRRA